MLACACEFVPAVDGGGNIDGAGFRAECALRAEHWRGEPIERRAAAGIHGGKLERVSGVDVDAGDVAGRMAAGSGLGGAAESIFVGIASR